MCQVALLVPELTMTNKTKMLLKGLGHTITWIKHNIFLGERYQRGCLGARGRGYIELEGVEKLLPKRRHSS